MDSGVTNTSLLYEDPDCPVYSNTSDWWISVAVFWVEGVGLSAASVFGILGNILASIVLSR